MTDDNSEEEDYRRFIITDPPGHPARDGPPRSPARKSLEQIKRKEWFKDRLQRLAALQGSNGKPSAPLVLGRELQNLWGGYAIVSFERRFADKALKFYKQKMHEKFEVVQVLFSSRAMIAVPGFGLDRLWCHVSFTAKPKYKPKKPKYTECERHFFGEMVFDPAKDDYHVIFCSIFNSSDPGLRSCVFCPSHEIFAHPAHGCPADGREKIDKFTGGIQMDACQGQMVQCSRLHPMRHACFMDDENEKKKHLERVKKINVGYAKIALGICEEKLGGEFEIVEILSTENKVVVRNESVPEELCHVYFTAKPREVDSCCVSPDYEFLGELLRDNTTNQYKAICCTILKPTDDSPEGFLKEVIRPYDIDGRFSLLEFPSFLITDGTDI